MFTLKELKRIIIDNNIAIQKLKELVDSGFKLVNEKLDHLTNLIEERLSGRWLLEKRFDAHLWIMNLKDAGACIEEDKDTFDIWRHYAVEALIHSCTFIEYFPTELNKNDYMDLFKLFKHVAIKYSELYYEKHNKEHYPVLYNEWMQIIADLENEFPELRDVCEVDIWNI